MKYRPIIISLVLGSLAAALAGCGQGTPAASNGKVSLRIGIQPNVSHAVPLVGFSDKEKTYAAAMPDVAFDVKTFNAGPAMMESLKAGALDVALFGPPPILNTWARTHDFVVLTNTAIGGSVLVARPNSGIRSVKDLAGKTVAVPQIGNVQDVFVRVLLKRNGLATKEKGGTVNVLALESPVILAQMQAGQVDAALVPEPWGSRLEKEAKAEVVLDWNQLPLGGKYPQTMYIASRKWVEAHPEASRKLVEVTNTLTEKIAADPDAFAEAISEQIKARSGKSVPPDLVRASFRRVKFSTAVTEQDLDAFAGLLVEAGYLKEKPELRGIIAQP